MRHLVLTDIHANLEALDAVSGRRPSTRLRRVLVLGDLVGYGADPNAVVERVRALEPIAIVRGNHDKVSCGLESADGFNSVARTAARWTVDGPDRSDNRRVGRRRSRRGRGASTTTSRSATARRSTRTNTSSGRAEARIAP